MAAQRRRQAAACSLTKQACGQHASHLLRHDVEVEGFVVGVDQRKAGVEGEEHGDDDVEQALTAAGVVGCVCGGVCVVVWSGGVEWVVVVVWEARNPCIAC